MTEKMNRFLFYFSLLMLIIGVILLFSFTFNNIYFNTSGTIEPDLASKYGSFIGGFIGTFFGLTSTLLLFLNFNYQRITYEKKKIEENYFRMIDYHYNNVNNLKIHDIKKNETGVYEEVLNRRAFVIFKLQLRDLLKIVTKINESLNKKLDEKSIIDIAYIAFYYGVSEEWKMFLINKLSRYEQNEYIVNELLYHIKKSKKRLGRTNQTSLSAYFRNMYNAIKYIDESDILSEKDKKENIKIFRAQLSNPELYILFFNIISNFGKKWIENNYVMEYEFLKNIPLGYLEDYDQKKYFNLNYEKDELN